jgi:pSer/pThr/pTyr-binding forkhead associated (FHA) protein
MSFRLVPLIKGTAPIISLHRPVLLIGRHLECDVRIDQTTISRRHCCLAMAYDRVVVRDLGSKNQIRVNGQVVEEAHLQNGDEVAIGPILYRLELLEENREASVPPTARPVSSPPAGRGKSPPPGLSANDSDLELVPLDDF